MNPYDFVRIDWSKGVERRPYTSHACLAGLSGRLEGTITTLTPFFIPKTKGNRPIRLRYKSFLTNGMEQAIIPGSSLKGLIRNLVETVGYGCWCFPEPEHENKIPSTFRACKGEKLCVACRMFGAITERVNLLGHAGFEDAECAQPKSYGKIYTPDLLAPRPQEASWYLDGNHVAGRKFYFHQERIWTASHLHTTRSGQQLNQYIEPLDSGNVFTFRAHFDNLAQEELGLLLYALVLEPAMRHKIGYAKPAGLGSVEIALTMLELIDYEQRYTSPDGGRTVYTGEALREFVDQQVAPYVNDRTSVTLQDLRRVWAWPPDPNTDYGYPAWT